MKVVRSHKIRLDPTKTQAAYFANACGASRFAYNWGLAMWKQMYEAGEKPSAFSVKKRFNAIKGEQFKWTAETTKWGPERAFTDLESAFKKFFAKTAKYPRFKRKGVRDSFYMSGTVVVTAGKSVKLPKIGVVRTREELRFHGKLISAVVSRVADKWFISIAVEFEVPEPATRESQAVGVDLGIKHAAVLSTGEKIEGPKALKAGLGKLRRLQKSLSRKVKGSANRRKAAKKVARCHYRVSCARNDFWHKLTSGLVSGFTDVGIEDLNVKGMLANHKLARHIADQAFYEFRRQLAYKAVVAGTRVHVADRFFPSSKRCNSCGAVNKELKLSDRIWTCSDCGTVHDRDGNAANNLKDLAAGLAVTACGVSLGRC